MKLLREIIELATDNQIPLTGVLRKCLVLAYSLKNERLKTWVEKELNGYRPDDELPAYRVAYPVSKGHLFGPSGARVENLPLATLVLKEEHGDILEKVELREPVATYLPAIGEERSTKKWVAPAFVSE
jgi:AbiTii